MAEITRDHQTIEQSVWSEIRGSCDLGWLTIAQAKQIVAMTAQLIRWREQEIAESLKPSAPAPEILMCAFEDCDQDRATGSDLCQAHMEFNAAEDALQAARRVLSNFKSADIVAVEDDGKPVLALTEEQSVVLDEFRSCTRTPGCCLLHGHDGECDTTDIPF